MSDTNGKREQNVILKDRREIKVSGIESVDSFDEERISATCIDGISIFIEGIGLSVKEVNLENGFFEASGDIRSFYYDERRSEVNGGFFKRLLSKQ